MHLDADSTVGGGPAAFAGHLALVAEMARAFAGSGDLEGMLRSGLARITAQVGAEASSVFLLDGDGRNKPDIVCHACHGPVDITGLRLPWGVGIVGRCISQDAPQMVRDAANDPDFGGTQIDASTGFITKSLLVAPLSVNGECLGAVEIINKQTTDGLFEPEDARLLQALASAAALALSNMRLAAQLVEQEVMAREMELAAEIQRSLLPPEAPANHPLHGINLPVRAVSGDFWDSVTLPDGRVWFCIADVAGKGVDAALLMARTSALFRVLAREPEMGPGRMLARISDVLCETATRGKFVTMAAGVYDAASGRVVLANAGHEPPLVHDRHDDSMRQVETESPPLGIAAGLLGAGCAETELHIGPGKALYLFTDGLTEAGAGGGAMLGLDGVQRLIRAVATLPAHRQPREIVRGALSHASARHDDLTVVVLCPAGQHGGRS